MPSIEIVLSPALWPLVDAKDKNIVVIDIFRATSTIAAALLAGADAVHPVKAADETLEYKAKGYLTAGERNGLPIEGFDFGNSPVLIQNEKIKGKKLALTTTNGTKCFEMAKTASPSKVFSGAFANVLATANQLMKEQKDVILFCAGWKDQVNLEDSLYAGALFQLLKNKFEFKQDAVLIAESLYDSAQKIGMVEYLKNSSHYQRLKGFGADRDMEWALKSNILKNIIVLQKDELVLSKNTSN